ncbi:MULTISPECIES: adenylate/guanylate cyclase domain-containing protein [Rhodococcus]|uniref:adenylate/guanylate cyclase domain-containing protein n=1 Tax=Rhodococcus TaxID=1827 RepID=UPI0033F7CC61
MTPSDERSQATPEVVATIRAELERTLLGVRRYTLREVADLAGLEPTRVRQLWQALGFTVDPDPGAVMFTDGDLGALRNIAAILGSGAVDPSAEISAARSLGQSMSRLSEWQFALLSSHVVSQLSTAYGTASTPPEDEEIREFVDDILRRVANRAESLQGYMWRRHLVATTNRTAVRAQGDAQTRPLVVGFADMVGYTQLTRRIDADELNVLLDHFEAAVSGVITRHAGWVIKTVGDEVMFASEDAVDAARIALELQQAFAAFEDTPALRIGLASGPALARFGDLFGSVVNIAARLTGAARPGSVLVDEQLAEALEDHDEFRLHVVRNVRVKDFRHSRAYVLRPPRHRSKDARNENGPSPAGSAAPPDPAA